jgi:hypothetical protein
MAGMMSGVTSAAEGLGNNWGSAYGKALKGDMSGVQGMGSGGGYQKFMGMAQPQQNMAQPQGQDLMSLMQMLQGGQQPRSRQRGQY